LRRRGGILAGILAIGIAGAILVGFLARAGRFRIPALSIPGLLVFLALQAGLSWLAKRGHGWARRTEAGLLLGLGAYLALAPTRVAGGSVWIARGAGIVLASWGLAMLARIVRDEFRNPRD